MNFKERLKATWKGTFFFILICLLLQYSSVILGALIRKNVTFIETSETKTEIALKNLQPGDYYLALGQAWGNWDIFLDNQLLTSSHGPFSSKKEKLTLGTSFEISKINPHKRIIIYNDPLYNWRRVLAHSPVIATYWKGLCLQIWRSVNELLLGPIASLLLLVFIFISYKISFIANKHLKGLLLISITGFLYTVHIAGYFDLFFDIRITTIFQMLFRCAYSAAIIYFYGTYSKQNYVLLWSHGLIALIAILIGIRFHLYFIPFFKFNLAFYFTSLSLTVLRMIKEADWHLSHVRILSQFGLAWCFLNGVMGGIYIFQGPSIATLITPAATAVLALIGMYLAYKEVMTRMVERERLRFELENIARFGTLASQVAHDIRSPLTLLQVVATHLKGVSQEHAGMIDAATARMRKIAEDLLEEYRRARDKKNNAPKGLGENPEPIEFRRLIEKALAEKRAEFSSHPSLQIDFTAQKDMRGIIPSFQEEVFFRCLSNLINNAAEACHFQGVISVSVAESQGKILIAVRDEGCGVPRELLAKLGQSGFSYGKANGNGLGLSYVKTRVSEWGGDLLVESELGKGTKVTIALKTSALGNDIKDPACIARNGLLV